MTQQEMTTTAGLPSTGIPGVNPDTGVVEDEAALAAYKEGDTPHPASVSEFDDDYSDGVELHTFDHTLPVIELLQAQTGDMGGGKPGQFIRRDTGEIFDELSIVPMAVKPTRTLWPTKFSRTARPLCASANGYTTTITIADHVERGCDNQLCKMAAQQDGERLMECKVALCPHYTNAPWDQKRDAGFCSPGYAVLGYEVMAVLIDPQRDYELGEAVMMRLGGTSAGIAKTLGHRKMVRQRVMRLTAEETTTDEGKFYTFSVTPSEDADKRAMSALWRANRSEYQLALTRGQEIEELDALAAPQGGFTGSVGRDPELRYTPSAKAVCEFSLSVGAEWYRVVAWEQDAEWVNENVHVGQVVRIEGSVKLEEVPHQDGSTFEIPTLTVHTIDIVEETASPH